MEKSDVLNRFGHSSTCLSWATAIINYHNKHGYDFRKLDRKIVNKFEAAVN